MSTRSVFVFVEGTLDRYFIGRVCQAHLGAVDYELAYAAEIPEQIGSGKGALLALYQFLRSRGCLRDDFQGKRTYVLFFLDKDVDDVLRSRRRSTHVVYTSFYELENHVFAAGDLMGALASAAQIDPPAALQVLGGDSVGWRRRAAETWQAWVVLCLCARMLGIRGPASFSRNSQVNNGCYGALDPALEAGELAALRAAARGVPSARFDAVLTRATAIVRSRYRIQAHDTIFKGKWYAGFVRHALTTALPGTPKGRLNGLEDRLLSLLAYSTPVDAEWTTRYRDALLEALAWCRGAAA